MSVKITSANRVLTSELGSSLPGKSGSPNNVSLHYFCTLRHAPAGKAGIDAYTLRGVEL